MGPRGSFGLGIRCLKANLMGLRFLIPTCRPRSGCNFALRNHRRGICGEGGSLGHDVGSRPSPGGSCGSPLACHLCPWGTDPWSAPRGWGLGSELDGWLDGSPSDQLPPHTGQPRKWLCWKNGVHLHCHIGGRSECWKEHAPRHGPLGSKPSPATHEQCACHLSKTREMLPGRTASDRKSDNPRAWLGPADVNRWVHISR